MMVGGHYVECFTFNKCYFQQRVASKGMCSLACAEDTRDTSDLHCLGQDCIQVLSETSKTILLALNSFREFQMACMSLPYGWY